MRVLVAMYHRIFGEYFTLHIKRELGPQVSFIWEDDYANTLDRLVEIYKPHLLIVDFYAPHSSNEKAIENIVGRTADTRIIGVSNQFNASIDEKLRKAGAHGYLLRDDHLDTMVQIIRKVLAGGNAFDSDIERKSH